MRKLYLALLAAAACAPGAWASMDTNIEYLKFNVDPSNAAPVTEIPATVNILFDLPYEVYAFNQGTPVTVTRDGETYCTAVANCTTESTGMVPVVMDQPITEPGTYTFSIAVGDPTYNIFEWNSDSPVSLSYTYVVEAGQEPATSAVTEDFESGATFASTFGKWTLVDKDAQPISMLLNIDFSKLIDNGEPCQSFWVMDATDPALQGKSFAAAHSGTKYMTQMVCAMDFNTYSAPQCDDWAISPELSGNAQTISLWARGFDPDWGEIFQVLYSTDSTDPDDFVQVGDDQQTAGWKQYDFELPAGAKYFAIRCISWDVAMFMFDDVTYEAAASTAISEINAAAADAPVYYDLTGRRVAQPGHGVYVRVQGNKASKVKL